MVHMIINHYFNLIPYRNLENIYLLQINLNIISIKCTTW